MGYIEALTRASPSKPCSPQILACVDPTSLPFLQSHSTLPQSQAIEFFKDSDHVFDRLWRDSSRVSAVVLDQCAFDFEELFYASLNHPHVIFVVRSHGLDDDIWFRRYARQPNIKLPCSDFVMWSHAFSSSKVTLWSELA